VDASDLTEHLNKAIKADDYERAAWLAIGRAHATSNQDRTWSNPKADAWFAAAGCCLAANLFAEGAACARQGLQADLPSLGRFEKKRLEQMLDVCERGAK
jgi:hypothetical protein